MSASTYEEMFGGAFIGRPPMSEHPTGNRATGDPRITEAARRRATRVLRVLHREEFERLMQQEIKFLEGQAAT